MSKQSGTFTNVKDEEKSPTRRRSREVADREKRYHKLIRKIREKISLDQDKVSLR